MRRRAARDPCLEPHLTADRRVLPALCLGMFVAMLTFVAPAPFFPVMARDLNVGVPLLGQVVAAMLLISAAFGLVAGPLADRYGHRRLIVLGLAAAAAFLLTFGLATAFPVLLLGALAGGLANAAVIGPSLAVAGAYFSGPAARQALGWATACMACSAIVGVPVMTAVGAISGWRTAFIAVGIAVMGAALLGAAWLPRDELHPSGRLRPQILLAAYRPLLRHGPGADRDGGHAAAGRLRRSLRLGRRRRVADRRQPGRRGHDHDAARIAVQPGCGRGRGHRGAAAGHRRLRPLAVGLPGFGLAAALLAWWR